MKQTKSFICAAVLFALFIALILAVLFVDVQAIGPNDSEIGLSTLNGRFFDKFSGNIFWYSVTETLGYAAVVVMAIFIGMALGQLYKRKSLKRVDGALIALITVYTLLAFLYVFFEIVIINYRPVLEENALAASFPSSHTMLICTAMLSGCLHMERLTEDKVIRGVATAFAYIVVIITVVGRALSGVHWLTDIIGGVLISAALVMLYIGLSEKFSQMSSAITKK
ncbi:MAG: phosphatase PAP2 family protein [Clostridia bacterium]|nr:phosphatase PAP2 family protein [Clostridia bacterium]